MEAPPENTSYVMKCWNSSLDDIKIAKEEMNKIVMDFLLTEGFHDAAQKFHLETRTQLDMDPATVLPRMLVKKDLINGNVDGAIEKVNKMNPNILDSNPVIYFHLYQLKMIELIREGKVEEAVEVGQKELLPRVKENETFMGEVERTMTLLLWEDFSACPYDDLLDKSLCLKIAIDLNAAILTSQGHSKGPMILSLLKMLIFNQDLLDDIMTYPHIKDLSTGRLTNP